MEQRPAICRFFAGSIIDKIFKFRREQIVQASISAYPYDAPAVFIKSKDIAVGQAVGIVFFIKKMNKIKILFPEIFGQ